MFCLFQNSIYHLIFRGNKTCFKCFVGPNDYFLGPGLFVFTPFHHQPLENFVATYFLKHNYTVECYINVFNITVEDT